ncbi:hypothetical protein M433DRAFT_157635 [Acidomyces richmondensis BFW]|nr:MAG: hypothetical protein FE78DRAFT_86405 [Acidomyces sp. 'richmondensis']KYG42662.1 hypothetical protein M433DRAFT_157635 [Acidomyces richmondensis BFW]
MTRLDQEREEFRIVFNITICGRDRQGEAGFEEVGVLLLTWRHEDLFGRDSEVPRLRDTFGKKFHFTVREYQIPPGRSATEVCSRSCQLRV